MTLVVTLMTDLDPYCDPCHDLVYGSNSSTMESPPTALSPSGPSARAHEQVMAEHRKTLTTSMKRKSTPKTMHRYSNQGGLNDERPGRRHDSEVHTRPSASEESYT